MIPDCDRRSDGRTESIIAKTALSIASYADALSKRKRKSHCDISLMLQEITRTHIAAICGR